MILFGKATTKEGYLEANIFDSEGNKKKGLGGGNCQVSSTLYNAILEIPGMTIIERHEHSSNVYYVPDGKDASVAFGSNDFKFRNDAAFAIKIEISTNKTDVIARIYKV